MNDEAELLNDVTSDDNIVGAMCTVVKNNQIYVFQPDVGTELREANFRKGNVFMMLMYS